MRCRVCYAGLFFGTLSGSRTRKSRKKQLKILESVMEWYEIEFNKKIDNNICLD